MAVNIDWGLNHPTDIAGPALQGFLAGRQQHEHDQVRNALQAYDPTNPQETGARLVQLGDVQGGSALITQGRQEKAGYLQDQQARLSRQQAGAVQVLEGLLAIPENQRHAAAPDLIRGRTDVWSPDEIQPVIEHLGGAQVDLSTATLQARLRAMGGNPNAGAIDLGPNHVYGVPGGPVLAVGANEPVVTGQLWHTPTLPAVGSNFGGAASPAPSAPAEAPAGVSAPPAVAQPQEAAPGGRDQASGFNRDMMARLLIGEGVQGPGQVAVANVVFNRARALGVSPDQVITAPHQFEPYGNHTRWQQLQAIPTTDPRYQAALQAIDQAAQQDITNGATHFYSPAIMAGRGGPPTWAQGHQGTDIGGNTFLRLPFGGHGGGQPAEAPAGQTAPDSGDAGLPPGYHRLPAAPPSPPAQGHTPTAAERTTYPGADFIEPSGAPHYPPASATAAASGAPGDTTLNGQDYLRSLPTAMRNQVRALAEGRQAFTNIPRANRQQFLDAVAQYDPEFNAQDYASRYRTRAAFTSGPQSQNITALNTGIGHLSALDSTIDHLGNISFPVIGNWINARHQDLARGGGDPTIVRFQQLRDAVANESVRIFRGVGGAEADISRTIAGISEAQSPQQLHAAVRALAELWSSRVDALTTSYQQGMGTAQTTIPGLSPHAVDALDAMREGRAPPVASTRAVPAPQRPAQPMPDRSGNFSRPAAAPAPAASSRPAPPRVGAVVRGFRYTGGDPANPRSWQRAQ